MRGWDLDPGVLCTCPGFELRIFLEKNRRPSLRLTALFGFLLLEYFGICAHLFLLPWSRNGV